MLRLCLIFVFSIQLIVDLKFAIDWIRTMDLWCRKQLVYQLSHNLCPRYSFLSQRVFMEANKLGSFVQFFTSLWYFAYKQCDQMARLYVQCLAIYNN